MAARSSRVNVARRPARAARPAAADGQRPIRPRAGLSAGAERAEAGARRAAAHRTTGDAALATQSQLAAARKALADAQAALDGAAQHSAARSARHTLDAPADGVVTALRVGLGERVAANAPLLELHARARAGRAARRAAGELARELRAGMPVQLQPVYGARHELRRHAAAWSASRSIRRPICCRPRSSCRPTPAPALVAGAALTAQIRRRAISGLGGAARCGAA